MAKGKKKQDDVKLVEVAQEEQAQDQQVEQVEYKSEKQELKQVDKPSFAGREKSQKAKKKVKVKFRYNVFFNGKKEADKVYEISLSEHKQLMTTSYIFKVV